LALPPPLRTDERDEAHGAEVGLPERAVGIPDDLYELLHTAGLADRHDKPSASLQLVSQGARHMTPARGRQYGVIGGFSRPPASPIPLNDFDIGVSQPLEPLLRDFDKLMLPLDADDLASNPTDDRGGISRAGADLEHGIALPDSGGLDHQGISPLHRAVQSGKAALVKKLVEAGADVDLREGRWHGTPMSWSVVLGKPEVVAKSYFIQDPATNGGIMALNDVGELGGAPIMRSNTPPWRSGTVVGSVTGSARIGIGGDGDGDGDDKRNVLGDD